MLGNSALRRFAGDSVYCVTLDSALTELPEPIWGGSEDFPNFPTHLGIFCRKKDPWEFIITFYVWLGAN